MVEAIAKCELATSGAGSIRSTSHTHEHTHTHTHTHTYGIDGASWTGTHPTAEEPAAGAPGPAGSALLPRWPPLGAAETGELLVKEHSSTDAMATRHGLEFTGRSLEMNKAMIEKERERRE